MIRHFAPLEAISALSFRKMEIQFRLREGIPAHSAFLFLFVLFPHFKQAPRVLFRECFHDFTLVFVERTRNVKYSIYSQDSSNKS